MKYNNKLPKRYWAAVMGAMLVVVAGFAFVACVNPNSDTRDRDRVQSQQAVYERNQPVPRFEWSQDRDTLIQIYRAKNEALLTWTVFISAMGTPIDSCPSRGFPLPADTQLTNPAALAAYPGGGTAPATVEQAEPNGLFTSHNTHATYVLCIRPNGDIAPVWVEPEVLTYPFAVHVQDGKIIHDETSPTSVKIKKD